MKVDTFVCGECGEELYGYYEVSEGRYVVSPCDFCLDERHTEGKFQGYLEGNTDNLYEG